MLRNIEDLERRATYTGDCEKCGTGMHELCPKCEAAPALLKKMEAQEKEIARLKAELELARGFMPKGTTLAPPSHEPWRKG